MVLSLWKELFYGVIHLLEYAAYTEIHTKSDGKTNKENKTFMSGESQIVHNQGTSFGHKEQY